MTGNPHAPENADRPRHMHGGRHQQPAFARSSFDEIAGENSVFKGVARAILINDVAMIKPDAAPELPRGIQPRWVARRAATPIRL